MLKFETVLLAFVFLMGGLFGASTSIDIPWWAFVLPVIVFLGINIWGSAKIDSGFHINTLCQAKTAEKKICLTFDDGPVKHNTLKISEVLNRHNTIGTFFMIGKNIAGNEHVVKELDRNGHLIGNHSFNHSTLFDFQFSGAIQKEMEKTESTISEVIGKKIAWFRPPYGVTTPHLKKAVEKMDYQVIGWNIRSLDTIANDFEKLTNKVIGSIQPGSIILFHDTTPNLPEVLERVLTWCGENNYKCVGVDELLNIEAYA